MKIEMVPHDPNWRAAFKLESQRVAQALGENLVRIHHIGSTAIPGIYAKPVIDMLPEVKAIADVDERTSAMEALGYEAMGELGIPGRRYFRKESPEGVRTHHVHAFQVGDVAIERHLAFRDFMIVHPEHAKPYSELKRKLAAAHPDDIYAYMDGKDAFIEEMQKRALEWRLQNGSKKVEPAEAQGNEH